MFRAVGGADDGCADHAGRKIGVNGCPAPLPALLEKFEVTNLLPVRPGGGNLRRRWSRSGAPR
jgi:hypothetical protein